MDFWKVITMLLEITWLWPTFAWWRVLQLLRYDLLLKRDFCCWATVLFIFCYIIFYSVVSTMFLTIILTLRAGWNAASKKSKATRKPMLQELPLSASGWKEHWPSWNKENSITCTAAFYRHFQNIFQNIFATTSHSSMVHVSITGITFLPAS